MSTVIEFLFIDYVIHAFPHKKKGDLKITLGTPSKVNSLLKLVASWIAFTGSLEGPVARFYFMIS